MTTIPAQLRAEPHNTIGTAIIRDAGVIIDRWARRAKEEEPSAGRVHHDVLLDHLPTFLWELGRTLADSGSNADPMRHCRPAGVHGDQRWEAGWSIEEVVKDYQLLRLMVTDHLDETIKRPLSTREMMALGVFIDDAIAASVSAFLACQSESKTQSPAAPSAAAAQEPRSEELLSVLGVLGHELRNPLAPLGNAIQVMRLAPGDNSVIERATRLMDRQHKALVRLVDDLLDFPRLARGKMQLKSERMDLVALVRDAVDDRRAAFESAGLALQSQLPPEPLHTTGDALRLTQVIGNLLQNAAKFTDRGGEVVVALSRDPVAPMARLSVKDTGIGIDPAVLPRVFEAFVQADRALERTRGGLGLGLALVKGIVELHGGTVSAKSDGPGKGAELQVTIPLITLAVESKGDAGCEVAPSPSPKRVLVIEDNEDSAESVKVYLELLGHVVTIAPTGADGVRLAATELPDVVVCDIGLPGMSGHEVCAELRKLPAKSTPTLIALSGHSVDAAPSATLANSFDRYLLKPVAPQILAEAIRDARLLSR